MAIIELEQELTQVMAQVANIMGGVLIGLLEAKYDSKNRQHIELVRAANLSGFIGLLPPKTVLYTPQLANILGMHGSSNGIIRIGMPKGVFTI